MYFTFACFLCKCFSSSIHMLLMHVFQLHLLLCAGVFRHQSMCIHVLFLHVFFAHLLFMQVFFVVSWRAYTCFSCMYFLYTCFLCKYFLLSVDVHTHASHACIFCTLAFYARIFRRQLMCIHILLMHVCFLFYRRLTSVHNCMEKVLFGDLNWRRNAGRLASFLLFHHYFEWEWF